MIQQQIAPTKTWSVQRARTPRLHRAYALWGCYGIVAAGMAGYAILVSLHGGRAWSPVVPWGIDVLEAAVAVACLSGYEVSPSPRIVRLIGPALLCWAAGDVATTLLQQRLLVFSPLIAAALHLAFFPLVIAGLIIFRWTDLRASRWSQWIDRGTAALGAAAVCSVVAYQASAPVDAGGSLYLLSLVTLAAVLAACFATTSEETHVGSCVLGAGMAVVLAACLLHIVEGTWGDSGVARAVQATLVPLGLLLASVAVWVGNGRIRSPSREHRARLLLPNLAAAAALTVEFVDSIGFIDRVALLLAALTLLAAGIRSFVLLQESQAISEFRHEQAATDELTGVWNRRHIFRLLDSYFAKRAGGFSDAPLAFLFVDLNRFKEINDSFGHATGDQLIKALAARLAGSLRDSDVLGRLGGDEFGVILSNSDLEGATTVALRLSACLDHPFQLNHVSPTIGASIGIAVAPNDAQTSEDLVRCADVAMYRAKTENRRVASYEEAIDLGRDQMQLLQELRTAIEEDELVLYYQPQLDLRKGTLAGLEALLRWQHPRLGLLAPINFLRVAEEAGDIDGLTRWVVNRAASQCALWRARGLELTVSVNVSPSSLRSPNLVAMVTEALDRHGLPASSLVVEITENWVMSEIEAARASMQSLAALGVGVSIDDFGAGATSLAYLRNLPVKELKLDRAFVVGLSSSEGNDRHLLRSTIDLGHSLGLRIVAEGVEDAATLDLLSRLGCDLAQGYHISKPKPPNELAFKAKQRRTIAA